ncbi:MAG: RHS repeat-associated core domain-containing protein [Chloroflexota bacterium]
MTKTTGPSGVTYYIGEHFEVQGGVEVKYIFAAGRRVAMIKNGTVQYFHKDHLASTAVVTSSTGALVEKGSYMPFGTERTATNSGPAYASAISVSSYTYTDQERDSESGLYNYNARLYDPMTGRFLSADSIVPRPGDPQSLNRYSYCLNNPLVYVDPSGHFFVIDDIIAGAIFGFGVSSFTAALMGGDLDDMLDAGWKGAITGGIFGGVGFASVGLSPMQQVGMHFLGGALSGGIISGIEGTNVGMGMLVGGVSPGVGKFASPHLEAFGFFGEWAGRTLIGGVMGGASAELYGGEFGNGFRKGATTAAIAFLANDVLHPRASKIRVAAKGVFRVIVRTTEPSAEAMDHAQRLANMLKRDLVMTSGYRPGARGPHGTGNAFDLGHRSNQPAISREEMVGAYEQVFDVNNSMALEETTCYHFQLEPGRGGATGFLPGLRDPSGKVVGR